MTLKAKDNSISCCQQCAGVEGRRGVVLGALWGRSVLPGNAQVTRPGLARGGLGAALAGPLTWLQHPCRSEFSCTMRFGKNTVVHLACTHPTTDLWPQ